MSACKAPESTNRMTLKAFFLFLSLVDVDKSISPKHPAQSSELSYYYLFPIQYSMTELAFAYKASVSHKLSLGGPKIQ